MKSKFTIIFVMLMAFVLIGAGCLQKSPKSFYKKVCKTAIEFSEELDDVLGQELAMLKGGDDLDDCVDDMIEEEENLYDECMDEEDDENVCDEVIENYRSIIGNFLTRQGCQTIYSSYCAMHQMTGEYDDFNECMDNIEGLCNTLPRSF